LPRLERCRLPAAVAQAVFKKQAFQAGGERACVDPGDRKLPAGEPQRSGIPADTAADLRSAGAAVRARGVQVLNEPSISIVGTRRPTLYGTQMAERLGREIAARGVVVVSGMARGMDAIAPQGAMVVHGRAIGVLGTGVNVCYPRKTGSCTRRCSNGERSSASFP
jgi:DNA processing protein